MTCRDRRRFKTLTEPHVELIDSPVERIDESGVFANGEHYDADCIIWGTGFKSNKFLWPIDITGRGGVTKRAAAGNQRSAAGPACVCRGPASARVSSIT